MVIILGRWSRAKMVTIIHLTEAPNPKVGNIKVLNIYICTVKSTVHSYVQFSLCVRLKGALSP